LTFKVSTFRSIISIAFEYRLIKAASGQLGFSSFLPELAGSFEKIVARILIEAYF
jgi:hypothetical protein